jgi:hypothetical protein
MDVPAIIKSSVPRAYLKKKGDLATATDDGQLDTVSLGPDGTVLTADSSQPTGFKWISGNGSPTWGSISGTLSNQSDLENVLNGKEPANANIQAHIAAIGNPHGTTKAQIGLDNVTNEAQIPRNIGTAKGSLIGFSASGAPLEVPAGADAKVLTADAAQPSGVAWKDAPGGAPAWGNITGTLNSQTDLQTALQTKSDVNHTHISSQVGLGNVTDDKQVKAAATSVAGNLVSWSGATGDAIVDSGKKASDFAAVSHVHAPGQVGLGNLTNDAQVKKAPASIDSNLVAWSGTAGDTVVDSGKKILDLALATHNHNGVYEPANPNIQSHISSTANPHNVTANQVLPDQTGKIGAYLTSNGTMAAWTAAPDGLPAQTGKGGMFLTTNGTNPSWGDPQELILTPGDGLYSGLHFTGMAGENLNKGDVVYLKAADFKFYKADCSDIAKLPAVAIATANIALGSPGTFVKSGGYLGNSGWAWTASPLFVSTGGALTSTAPTTSGYYVQVFGYPTSLTSIAVEPDKQPVQVP